MSVTTRAWLMAIVLLGCAGGPRPTGTPANELGARRVMQIFQSRHLRPRQVDAALSHALFDHVLSVLNPSDTCRQTLLGERERLDVALLAGDFTFPSRVASCGSQDIGLDQGRTLMLDAFAKTHDPHSAYMTSDALAALRAQIHAPDASATHVRGRIVEHAGARIAVIAVPSFYLRADRSTSRDMVYIVEQLAAQGAQVIVLDMRGNGGGVQSEAAKLVGLFAGTGPVVQTSTANGTTETLHADTAAVWQGPLLVVVDAMSASVTEVVAAALQDRHRALIVGQRTHGKGTGQTLVLLSSPRGSSDGAVRVTDRSFHRLDGRPLQREGVTPDIELPTSAAAVTTERDRPGALVIDAIAPIDALPSTPAAPDANTFPFSAALAWLREAAPR